MATLANDGTMYKPRVVSHIDNPRTGERRTLEPQVVRELGLRPEHVAFVKQAMVGVTKEGTSARAFAGAQYTSGGKTGTAQVVAMKQGEKYDETRVAERLRDHSLYIAFAPLESPKIALAVLVENGGFGARAAAPIARTVLDYFLLGKRPKAPAQPAPAQEPPPESDAESD
jgi:penicillin-binding protein 2